MGIDLGDDERQMLYDLIHVFIGKYNAEQQRAEDLTRQLEAERERLAVLTAQAYGYC